MNEVSQPTQAASLATASTESTVRVPLRLAIGAGILIGLLVVLFNLDRRMVPMVADLRGFGLIFLFSIVPIAAILSGYAYVQGVKDWNRQTPADRQRGWKVSVAPVGLAYGVLAGILTIVGLVLVDFAFKELTLDRFQGAFIVGALGAALAYWSMREVTFLTASKLLLLTVLVLASGVYLTAATIDDPLWWQVSFSYLGTMNSSSRAIFNITLILGGLLLLIWLPLFLSDYAILVRHGVAREGSIKILRYALIVLAIAVAFVGVFKSGLTPFSSLMHNLSAYSLAAILALLMLGARWLVPGFGQDFFSASWVLVAALITTLLLAAVGYFNTVGLEIISFVLGLTWLSLFVNTVEERAWHLEPQAFPAGYARGFG